MSVPPSLKISPDLLICKACGTQFPVSKETGKDECRVCDDPRQFVPPSGQAFTTLAALKKEGYRNIWKQDEVDKRVWSIWTEPKFGIGQRAFLLQTPAGNIMWDLIAFLDEETVEKINSFGPLIAIVISHPHYYTTHADWSRTFNCPIYVSEADNTWLERTEVDGVTAIKCGGHFEGSLCLHWDGKLFIADTLVTVPSALNPSSSSKLNKHKKPHLSNTLTYTFMYSIPNMLPMPESSIQGILAALTPFEFHTTHGAFVGLDVRDSDGNGPVKERVWRSAELVLDAYT